MPIAERSLKALSVFSRRTFTVAHGRERVVVDDAKDAVVLLLHVEPLLKRAKVVAYVKGATGLNTAKKSFHGCLSRATASLFCHLPCSSI
jgi:hypothetical protein